MRRFAILSVTAIVLALAVGCDRGGSGGSGGQTWDDTIAQQEIETLIESLNRDPAIAERAARSLSAKSAEELKPALEQLKAALKQTRSAHIKQILKEAIKKAGG